MIISNLAVLLAERKLKVADLVKVLELINLFYINFIMMNLYVLILRRLIKICIALDVEVGDLLVFKKIDNNQNDNS